MRKKFLAPLSFLGLFSAHCLMAASATSTRTQAVEAIPTAQVEVSKAEGEKNFPFKIGIVEIKDISEKAPQMRRLSSIHSLEVQKLEEESKKVQAQIEELGYQMQRLLYQPNSRTSSIRHSEEQLRRNQIKLTEQLAELERKKQASTERRDQAKTAALSEWVQTVQTQRAQSDPVDLVLTGAHGIAAQSGAVLYFVPSEQLIDLTEAVVEVARKSYDQDESLSESEEESGEEGFAELGF